MYNVEAEKVIEEINKVILADDTSLEMIKVLKEARRLIQKIENINIDSNVSNGEIVSKVLGSKHILKSMSGNFTKMIFCDNCEFFKQYSPDVQKKTKALGACLKFGKEVTKSTMGCRIS